MSAEIAISFIRNYTVEPIARALEESALPLGLTIKSSFGAYDNLGAELATLATDGPTPALIVVTIDLEYFSGGLFSPKWSREQVLSDFNSLLTTIDALPASTFTLVSTFLPPFRPPLPWVPDHPVLGRGAIAFELNARVREFAAQRPNRCGVLDFERLAARLGEAASLDQRFGLMMKAPFTPAFAQGAAEEILRFLKCRYLPPKKVLVLDCDNTLWGGVAGECGPENIQLDPYEYPGVAFYRFQSEVLMVAEKGVLVCLCSKNDEQTVWQVFERNPHCLLTRRHLAGYRINWESKARNIKELALEFNLGLDSMVFVDDDSAECQMVRAQLPEVTVLQVPGKIYHLPGLLGASNLFDRLSIGKEDAERLQYYQAESGRRDLQKRHVDAQSFLRDLEMKAEVRLAQPADIARVAQLCQRTNQFNLTSKRYTESELASFLDDPQRRVFLLRAEDRFGSMGNSGLIIWKKNGGAVEVDTFLMSCRIIGRLFDRALFCRSLDLLQPAWAFEVIHAQFIPTPKNGVVSKLWPDYGFTSEGSSPNGSYVCKPTDLKVAFPDVIQLVETL